MLQRALPAGFIAPCLPTKTDKLPSGRQWLHEIKHDGFRIIARKNSAAGEAPALSMVKLSPAMTTAWRRLISFATTATTTVYSSTLST